MPLYKSVACLLSCFCPALSKTGILVEDFIRACHPRKLRGIPQLFSDMHALCSHLLLRRTPLPAGPAFPLQGDDLLSAGYPAVHTVGRACSRPPALIDIRWAPDNGGSRWARSDTLESYEWVCQRWPSCTLCNVQSRQSGRLTAPQATHQAKHEHNTMIYKGSDRR